MCIGQPMQIQEQQPGRALVAGRGEERWVSTLLVDDPGPEAWVLVHLDAARQVLSAEEAARVGAALDGLEAALRGESVDAYFPDLVDREPPLPDFLRDQYPEDSQ
ncbi:HypC/HybG/HupF family hydrogenase formation chaperone [Thiohalorhabdus methylotrophus]|uniref:HypC/HybG/HupF family hydrogenase formation chaperone n=1 Tax=Thiohalorhabdus methylotrophus TaxID=3242694 RepID=A0ABV4TZK7_9GAMM